MEMCIRDSNYFEGLRSDYEGAYYGMYFLEVCDYCTRENNDERELLKLLYQSCLLYTSITNSVTERRTSVRILRD